MGGIAIKKGGHAQSGSGSLVALSTDMSQFYLNATTLTNLISGVLFGSSGGYVAYEQAAQLCDWIAAGGSVLLFNAAPGQVNLTGSTLYFTNGASQTVYAVPMHDPVEASPPLHRTADSLILRVKPASGQDEGISCAH